ncbi:hypothetical protein AVEN_158094-1 [Araneus ventricosus]|uniref:Uncharacterized protein n=1 Tax=Araneus ventricosus TaxID=182803 RepID=A0A4Y2HT84_ARAVE|nr:hypothetical protein AVEN_158094-1 [Araneus ventricosus]
MAAGIVRIVRKLPSSPNTSGRVTLTKKARAAGGNQSHLTKGGGNSRVTFGRFARLSSFASRDVWDGPVSIDLNICNNCREETAEWPPRNILSYDYHTWGKIRREPENMRYSLRYFVKWAAPKTHVTDVRHHYVQFHSTNVSDTTVYAREYESLVM